MDLSSLLPSLDSVEDMLLELTTPKRLFDTYLMKTVMYEDAVDIEEHGYVAISHVWGKKEDWIWHKGNEFGVTWEIPLSDPDKISRVKDAVLGYGEKYCWFDVLCLSQDRQDEVNEEIPLMGDYYAGSNAVFVLPTVEPVISEEFTTWYDMMSNIMGEKRGFTKEELDWIESHKNLYLFDISGEKWFTRIWTFQEAIMAKKLVLICSNGKHVDLFDVASKIREMFRLNVPLSRVFETSGISLTNIFMGKDNYLNGHLDLMQVMKECSKRDCFKDQDKFYGALGILRYKDFPIDYEINMEDLNKAIVKHAYSKGDLSWLSVGGDIGIGFIRPMDKPFSYVGWVWKEDIPGICGVGLGEIMYINAWSFAKVVCHEKFIKHDTGDMYRIFKSWKLDNKDIVKNMSGYRAMSSDDLEVVEALLGHSIGDKEAYNIIVAKLGIDVTTNKHIPTNRHLRMPQSTKEVTIIKATTWENKDIPLTIHGDAKVGDRIMLVRMTDKHGRILGIVVDKHFRRKGVCLCEKVEMSEEEALSRFTPQEFPL